MARVQITEFQLRMKMLAKLGMQFHTEYEYRGKEEARARTDVNLFTSVKIPFSAYELVGILMNEGPFYIGGCCGNTSVIQDKIESVLRFNDGWINVRDLAEIAEARIHHDGEGSEFNKTTLPLEKEVVKCAEQLTKGKADRATGKKLMDPWYLMSLAWHLTKDHYGPERPHTPANIINKKYSELDEAVSTLSRGLRIIAMDKVFGHKRDDKDTAQDNANRLILLARILPALKTLNEQIDTMIPAAMKGIALVHRDAPDVVLTNGLGLCIFGSQERAKELIKLWSQEEKAYEGEGKNKPKLKPAASEFLMRNVTVTKKKGVQFK